MTRKLQTIIGILCLMQAFSMAIYTYYIRHMSASTKTTYTPSLQTKSLSPLPGSSSIKISETSQAPEIKEVPITEPSSVASSPDIPHIQNETLKMSKGETLLTFLTRIGISKEEAHQVIKSLHKTFNPKQLKTGQEISLVWKNSSAFPTKELQELSFSYDLGKNVIIKRQAAGNFKSKKEERPLQKTLKKIIVTIQGSLVASAQEKGIPGHMVSPLIQAFSYDVDFQRDIKKGDKFEVVLEKHQDPLTKKERLGSILYASLHLQKKKNIELYRFSPPGKDAQFYNKNGESIRKALMRTPINGAKVNSNFGVRKDPIRGFSRMHKGVDFRAPIGTPIMAAGDGVVKKAARSGGYGNMILIQHNGKYSTAYAHLNKFAAGIRPGAKVKQGMVIGYVGRTGRTTGPHLHFEVLENGVQINPNSIKGLSSGGKLLGKELKAFQELKRKIEQEIKRLEKI